MSNEAQMQQNIRRYSDDDLDKELERFGGFLEDVQLLGVAL